MFIRTSHRFLYIILVSLTVHVNAMVRNPRRWHVAGQPDQQPQTVTQQTQSAQPAQATVTVSQGQVAASTTTTQTSARVAQPAYTIPASQATSSSSLMTSSSLTTPVRVTPHIPMPPQPSFTSSRPAVQEAPRHISPPRAQPAHPHQPTEEQMDIWMRFADKALLPVKDRTSVRVPEEFQLSLVNFGQNPPFKIIENLGLLSGVPAIGHYGQEYNFRKRLGLIEFSPHLLNRFNAALINQNQATRLFFMINGTVEDPAHDSPHHSYNMLFHPWVSSWAGQRHPNVNVNMGLYNTHGVLPLNHQLGINAIPFNMSAAANVNIHASDNAIIDDCSPDNARFGVTESHAISTFTSLAFHGNQRLVTYHMLINTAAMETAVREVLRESENIDQLIINLTRLMNTETGNTREALQNVITTLKRIVNLPDEPIQSAVQQLAAAQTTTPQQASEPLECAICFDPITLAKPVAPQESCEHRFHGECLDTWFNTHISHGNYQGFGLQGACPLCRVAMPLNASRARLRSTVYCTICQQSHAAREQAEQERRNNQQQANRPRFQ